LYTRAALHGKHWWVEPVRASAVMVQFRSAGQFKGVSESETPPETPPGGVFRLAVLPLSRSPIAQGFSRPAVAFGYG
jgi:hypothetical protein